MRHYLALWFYLALTPAVAAQDGAPSPFLERAIQDHAGGFRYIDVGDMRAIQAQIRAGLYSAAACRQGGCPDLDCASANETLLQTAELHMRLQLLASALTHEHGLEVAHLENLHREALGVEADALSMAEVVLWQSFVVRTSALVIQAGLLAGDIEALQQAGADDDLWRMASALDEVVRDSIAAYQDARSLRAAASGEFQAQTQSPLDQLARLGDFKSDLDNLRNARVALAAGQTGRASANALALIAREVRNWGLQEIASRQAELDRMNREANRERAEAERYAERVTALSTQAAFAGLIAREALQMFAMLDGCIEGNCPIVPFTVPDVPEVLHPPNDADPIRRPRLDRDALSENIGWIRRLGLALDYDWTQASCAAPDVGEGSGDEQVDLAEAIPDPSCEGLRNMGICSLLVPEYRAACEAGARQAIAGCQALPVVGERIAATAPGTQAQYDALADLCHATCTFQYGLDAYLDHQQTVARDQVAAFALGQLVSPRQDGGASEEEQAMLDEIDGLRARISATHAAVASRRRHIFYDVEADANLARETVEPDPDRALIYLTSVPGAPTRAEIDAIEEDLARIQFLRANLASGLTAWANEAREFWASYGLGHLLQCGGDELVRRRDQCLQSCGNGGFAPPQSCAVYAVDLELNFGSMLYPPADPRRDEIPAFSASALSSP